MSLVAALHLGKAVILVADTREVTLSAGKVLAHHDAAEKISFSGIGLISGSGFVDVLQPVRESVSCSTICHTDDIVGVIERETKKFRSKTDLLATDVNEMIRQSGWILTYRTEGETGLVLRAALMHGSDDHRISILKESCSTVWAPNDPGVRSPSLLVPEISATIRPLELFENLFSCVAYHMPIIRKLVRASSEASRTVSPTFQIGVSTVDGVDLISSRIHESDNEFTLSLCRSTGTASQL